jgi:phosphatidate cytidylyltransferase
MASSEFAKRLAVAAVGVPVMLGIGYAGGWLLAALLMVIAAAAALEFYRLAERKGAAPLRTAGAIFSASFVLLAVLAEQGIELAALGLLTVVAVLALATASIWTNGVEREPLLSISTTLTGAIYTGGLLSFGYLLRHLPGVEDPLHGSALLFAPVLLTWTSDTFAYFVGRQWGTRKLIPRVSPGKTVQGAIGALVGSVAVAVLYARLLHVFPDHRMTVAQAILFGLLISIAAQVGDLAESLLKRDAGVKDSGALLPGHGGALDRFDSLLFTLPVAYFFIHYWTSAA